MYCPPINHERFKKEVKKRYSVNCDQKSTKNIKTNKLSSGRSRLMWFIIHPMRVYKCVKDYYMFNDFVMILQMLYSLFLFHLVVKAVIQAMIVGGDKEKIKYIDSIYYPKFYGFSARPQIFDFLILGFSFYLLALRTTRIFNVINMALKNADEYKYLRVAQLNCSYLASFHLSLSEWIKLFKYANNHGRISHSDKLTQISHLEFNNLVQEKLVKLVDRDAIFYVNPIDFEKCYEDSVLADNKMRRIERYKSWHFAFPLDRVSLPGLGLIFLINVFGLTILMIGFTIVIFAVLILELRSEFPADYSPSTIELIQVIPSHWSSLLYCIRTLEAFVIMLAQVLNLFDLTCAFIDLHSITSRAHKMVQIFKMRIAFSRHKSRINTQILEFDLKQRLTIEHQYFINERDNDNSLYDLYPEYNKQTRNDIALTRLVYHEFLNAKKYNTGLFNLSIIGGGFGAAYMIPVLILHSNSLEDVILVAALLSTITPTVLILFYCARVERKVSSFIVI